MSVITGLATFGNGITGILNYWADVGVFSYVLPFLLIFAVVYGILSKIDLFGKQDQNKGVNAVIGVAVGLLALQFDYVPYFFSIIFPKLGVGISVLLTALILMGLFGGGTFTYIDKTDGNKVKLTAMGWTFFSIGTVIAVFVVMNSLQIFSLTGSGWWTEYGPGIITILIVGLLVALAIGGDKDKSSSGGSGSGSGGSS